MTHTSLHDPICGENKEIHLSFNYPNTFTVKEIEVSRKFAKIGRQNIMTMMVYFVVFLQQNGTSAKKTGDILIYIRALYLAVSPWWAIERSLAKW